MIATLFLTQVFNIRFGRIFCRYRINQILCPE